MVEQVVEAAPRGQEQVVVELEQIARAVPALRQRRGQRQRPPVQGAVLVGHDDSPAGDRPGGEHTEAAAAGVADEKIGAAASIARRAAGARP